MKAVDTELQTETAIDVLNDLDDDLNILWEQLREDGRLKKRDRVGIAQSLLLNARELLESTL